MGRLGGIAAPQIVNLDNISHNSHFLVFGVLGCVSGILSMILPETLGRPLPETPEDIYGRHRKIEKDSIPLKVGLTAPPMNGHAHRT